MGPLNEDLKPDSCFSKFAMVGVGSFLVLMMCISSAIAQPEGVTSSREASGAKSTNQVSAPSPSGFAHGIISTKPVANAKGVPLDQRIVVKFNRPVIVDTLNATTVTLIGPGGVTPVALTTSENGALLTIAPKQELLPASRYTFFVKGVVDTSGSRVPFTAIGFTTITLAGAVPAKLGRASSASLISKTDDETWMPDTEKQRGWTSGKAFLAKQSMPKNPQLRQAIYSAMNLQAHSWAQVRAIHQAGKASGQHVSMRGPASVVGQTLRFNGKPLANVKVRIGEVSATTDGNGEFALMNVPAGKQPLIIDGQSASRPDATYGRYVYQLDVEEGKVNTLPFVIWMQKLDTAHAVRIPSPTTRETIITTPTMPGFEMVLPAGTVIRGVDGKIVREISITPTPVDQTPFPMPYLGVSIYFTLQPGGAVIQGVDGKPKAAVLRYPNNTSYRPGYPLQLFDYDPTGRGWYIYSNAWVSKDGKKIVSDKEYKIYQFGATSVVYPSGTPPDVAPAPCPSKAGCTPGADGPDDDDRGCDCGGDASAGDSSANAGGEPVVLSTGQFELTQTDLTVSDFSDLRLRRTYRTLDQTSGMDIVGPFGYGTSNPYEIFLNPQGSSYAEVDLFMPNGTRIRFYNTSGAVCCWNNIFQNTDSSGQFLNAYLVAVNANSRLDWAIYFRDGRRWGFDYHNPKLAWVQDRNGNLISLTRPTPTSYANKIIGPSGRFINITYNGNGHIGQVTDNLNRTVTYAYDNVDPHRLLSVTDPEGGVRAFTWDSGVNRIVSVKDKNNNNAVTNTYDGNGRVSQQTLADSSTFGFAYTISSGNVTQVDVTDRRGHVRRVALNTSGYITSNTYPLGLAEQQITTYSVDSTTGRVNSVTDALSRLTTYSYDSLGNVNGITRLAGTGNAVTTTIVYDQNFSKPTSVTDPNSLTTTMSYDQFGNLIQVTDPLSHSTNFTRDVYGRVLTVQDALSHTTTFAYRGPDLASITDPLSRQIVFFTDAVGRAKAINDPLGNQTISKYDGLSRLTKVTDATGGIVQFTYDNNGNLLTHVDQKSNTTTFTYNNLNLAATKQDALSATESYAYDVAGKLNKLTDRKSQVSGNTYDGLNRVTQAGFGATTGSPTTYSSTIGFTWDAGNRLTQLVDSVGGTITPTFDGLDRLTQEVTTQGTVSYTYDAGGRRSGMTVSAQPAISYTWDNANRLTQIQQAAGSINNNTAQTIGFTYDNANRRTVTTLANGATINYAYDSANQLTGITYKKADTTTIGDLSYTYDNVGRRITAGGSLTAINLPSTVSSTTYNANNQLTSWAGSTFSYDANGSLTSDGTNTYTWDARNQLASLSGGISASFAYDGVRRRIGKTISGTTAGFVYDGMNFVQEKNGTGSGASVTANLITGPGVDEVYTRMTGTGGSAVLSHFLPDANNNVIRLLDGTQTVTDSYSYEAYGKTTYSGSNGNSQQYTGRENDGTGLYFYRARYYLPNAERFISEDPSGLSAGPNVYTYVNGNPVGRVDPTGLQTFTIGVGGAFQQTAAGASQSYSVGYSSPNGKFCIIATTCARFGPGESAGAGITASVSKGSFCSGDTATVGVFGEGGEGVIGGGSVDVGSEDVSGSVGFKGFVGAGAAGGTQVCATHTTCF